MKKITFIIALLITFVSHAQWNTDTAVNSLVADSDSGDMKSIGTSNGQTYVVFWKVVPAPTNYELRVQLLDATGNQQFGTDGALVSNTIPMNTFTSQWTVKIDDNDNLYIGATGTDGNVGFAYKVGIDGMVDWTISNPNSLAVKVLPMASGNTVVAWLNSSSFVVNMQKYDATGAAIWSSVQSLADVTSPADLFEISSENFILVYHLLGTGINSTLYAQRFDNSGSSVWTNPTQLSNKTTAFNTIYDGTQDGDIVYYGYAGKSATRFDSYLQRIDADGTLPWGINGADFDTNETDYEMETEISFSSGSNFVWSVCTYRNQNQSDKGEYIQKFDKLTGARQFTDNAKQVYAIGTDNSHSGELQLVNDQPLFLIKSGVDNGASPVTLNACYLDANGDFVWPEETKPVATFSANKSDVHFNKPANGQLVTVFIEDKGAGEKIYAQNFTDAALSINEFDLAMSLQFINPIKNELMLTSDIEINSININNVLGQLVFEKTVNSNEIAISSQSWETGIYFVNITFDNGLSKGIKILKE